MLWWLEVSSFLWSVLANDLTQLSACQWFFASIVPIWTYFLAETWLGCQSSRVSEPNIMMLQQKVLYFLPLVLLLKPTLSSPFLSAIKKLTQSPKSGLIISGGYDTMDSLTNTVELVMMKDGEVSQQCSLPAMPGARRGHIIEASVVTNSCWLYKFGIFWI